MTPHYWEVDRCRNTKPVPPIADGDEDVDSPCACDLTDQHAGNYQFCYRLHGRREALKIANRSVTGLLDPNAAEHASTMLRDMYWWSMSQEGREFTRWVPDLNRPFAFIPYNMLTARPYNSIKVPVWAHALPRVLTDFPHILDPLGLRVRLISQYGPRLVHSPWRGCNPSPLTATHPSPPEYL